jgi:hypothetical protein
MTWRERLRDDESGITLIEVIVTAMLGALVLAAVGGIYIGAVKAQAMVAGLTGASNDAQLAARDLDRAVRNGVALKVTASGDDQLLVVRSAGSGDALEYRCRAWFFDASAGELRSTTRSDGTLIAVPTADQLANWTLLAAPVGPDGETDVFLVDTADPTLVHVTFAALADDEDSTTVAFATALMPGAATAALGGSTCF